VKRKSKKSVVINYPADSESVPTTVEEEHSQAVEARSSSSSSRAGRVTLDWRGGRKEVRTAEAVTVVGREENLRKKKKEKKKETVSCVLRAYMQSRTGSRFATVSRKGGGRPDRKLGSLLQAVVPLQIAVNQWRRGQRNFPKGHRVNLNE